MAIPKITDIVPLKLNSYYQYPDIEFLDTLNLLADEINNERLCDGTSAIKIYIGYKGIIYNFILRLLLLILFLEMFVIHGIFKGHFIKI